MPPLQNTSGYICEGVTENCCCWFTNWKVFHGVREIVFSFSYLGSRRENKTTAPETTIAAIVIEWSNFQENPWSPDRLTSSQPSLGTSTRPVTQAVLASLPLLSERDETAHCHKVISQSTRRQLRLEGCSNLHHHMRSVSCRSGPCPSSPSAVSLDATPAVPANVSYSCVDYWSHQDISSLRAGPHT
ncbi:uncharacterized protein LOC143508327 [Brachyhypopomus gauderio]|uniref:uncharacterized protein LOC143508327 n=1 Tax=Brachyhypopomus gauderio TaxID=698409 RepID=UPI0040439415